MGMQRGRENGQGVSQSDVRRRIALPITISKEGVAIGQR